MKEKKPETRKPSLEACLHHRVGSALQRRTLLSEPRIIVAPNAEALLNDLFKAVSTKVTVETTITKQAPACLEPMRQVTEDLSALQLSLKP